MCTHTIRALLVAHFDFGKYYCCWAALRYSCAWGFLAQASSVGFKTSISSPATTRHTKSAIRFTCSILCETMMTVKPVDLHKCITDSSIWRVDTGSSALVGSSRSRTCPQLVKFVLKTFFQEFTQEWASSFSWRILEMFQLNMELSGHSCRGENWQSSKNLFCIAAISKRKTGPQLQHNGLLPQLHRCKTEADIDKSFQKKGLKQKEKE